MRRALRSMIFLCFASLALAGCFDAMDNRLRHKMVQSEEPDIQVGVVTDGHYTVDASQYRNPKLKLRIRNVSGETAFDLYDLERNITAQLNSLGFEVTEDNDFGIRLDIVVNYVGSITEDYAREAAQWGATLGTFADLQSGTLLGAGYQTGVVIGTLLGSQSYYNTYMVHASLRLATINRREDADEKTVIRFSSSADTIIKDREERRRKRKQWTPWKSTADVNLMVYAGGSKARQSDIADVVKTRFRRVLLDIM